MSIWVVIPVKPLNRAKSRLAEILSAEQRSDFAERMFRQVLRISKKAPQVTGILVISRDTKALAIARDDGAKTIQEGTASDLNPALSRATEVLRVWGAGAMLILPADLPFITTDDIERIIEMGMADSDACVVISTDRERDGTNALFVRPPGIIEYAYGVGSYDRHIAEARRVEVDLKYYQSENLILDIDIPADLHMYNKRVREEDYDLLPPYIPDMAT